MRTSSANVSARYRSSSMLQVLGSPSLSRGKRSLQGDQANTYTFSGCDISRPISSFAKNIYFPFFVFSLFVFIFYHPGGLQTTTVVARSANAVVVCEAALPALAPSLFPVPCPCQCVAFSLGHHVQDFRALEYRCKNITRRMVKVPCLS